MNCHEARKHLELYSLDPAAVTGAEALEARQHLDQCDACHLVLDAQSRFDAEVARAMSNVPLPSGLTERLQAAVKAASTRPASDNGPSRTQERRWPRRWIVTVGASLLLLFAGTWLWPRGAVLTEADLTRLAELDLNSLKTVPAGAPISVPVGWRSLRGLELSETPLVDSAGTLSVPLFSVTFRPAGRSQSATGLLIVLPESRWRPRPEATSLAAAENHYAACGTWAVWREGHTVFVCLLRNDARWLDELRRLVAGSRQVT